MIIKPNCERLFRDKTIIKLSLGSQNLYSYAKICVFIIYK